MVNRKGVSGSVNGKGGNGNFQIGLSFNMILQVLLGISISIFIVLFFTAKASTFHIFDGAVLLIFFYINYVQRFKFKLTNEKYEFDFDFIFLLLMGLEVIIFLGIRKIDIGLATRIHFKMWLETFVISALWLTFGLTLSVKKGFITFSGRKIDVKRALIMVVYIFVMAFIEEVYFRGFIFKYLNQMFGSSHILITFILSVFIFGIAHYKKRGWNMVLMATLAGIFYTLVYLRTGSIFCATMIHLVTNVSWLVFFKTNAPLQRRV